ncbi:RING finger protein 10 [Anthonomus grandis grandis]|uniref:RING finger protein 10 n=1 Tax=Anthonomus grandis grandis TaxID=2921223 RepID=UPI002165038A|nr:RING finger protein 10 [Anthonomus grandis grandis]
MEKKGNRTTPNTSRASAGTDLKKNSDVAAGKQGSRGASRRREPPCGFSKANESNRKPQPQRNAKVPDKRPMSRGAYSGGVLPRAEKACLNSVDSEWGSVFSPGSKKHSLNHLLNFSFAPRESYQNSYQPEKSNNGKWLVTRKHKYNKEHFLQANCQFIVNENGDYRQYLINPDALVDWDLIEQVNVQVNEEPSCPICLYPPVAAKMTKCGHIYCWPCILHYLALSDKQWRKCPICYDAVKKDDLKSVVSIPHKTFTINDQITFKLMKRQRGSLLAYPADVAQVNSETTLLKLSDMSNDNSSAKLFLANTDNILEILDREHAELEVLMAEDESCPERCFMEEAKQILLKRKDDVLNKAKPKQSSLEEQSESNLESKSVIGESETEGAVKFFYFYQAEDGQHIYLHGLNAKMLEHSYGSLEFGPKVLTGRILEKEGGSMTEELRKKLRYLQHLPVTCQFEVAEIHLDDTVVTRDTLQFFKEQVNLRKKKRQRRAKEENRREKKIEAEANRSLGRFEVPDLHLESKDHFPDVKEAHDMFPDYLDNRIRTESESTFLSSERSGSPDLTSSLSSMSLETNFGAPPSFATMLTSAKKPSWPVLKKTKPTNQPSSTPVKLINVTGANMAVGTTARVDHEFEDFEPVPDFNRSFGAALAEALAKGLEDSVECVSNDAPTPGSKKKKKTKQKLLFSTHMAFSSGN